MEKKLKRKSKQNELAKIVPTTMMTHADDYRKHDNRAWSLRDETCGSASKSCSQREHSGVSTKPWRWDLDMYWTGKVSPWMIENLDEFTNALLDSVGSSERASGTTSQPVDDVSFLTHFEGSTVSKKKLEQWFFDDDHHKKEKKTVRFGPDGGEAKLYVMRALMACPILPHEAKSRGEEYYAEYEVNLAKDCKRRDINTNKD